MEILNIVQGGEEWIKYRKNKISATDSSCILGLNPYMSANMLWEEKMSLRLPKEPNAAMLRGSKLEPEALAKFNEIMGITAKPCVIVSDEYPFAMASLDGAFGLDSINPKSSYIVEIKCPGKKNYEKYKDLTVTNEIDMAHFCQMQHQMMCSNLEMCYYFCYQTYDNFIVEVKRDDEFIEKMLIEEKKFYDCMMNFERPR